MLVVKKLLVLSVAFIMPIAALAEIEIVRKHQRGIASTSEPDLMSFKAWKDLKVIEAQNLSARLGNRIVLLKAGKIKPEDLAFEFPQIAGDIDDANLTARARKRQSSDLVQRVDREYQRSQKNLEFARELTIEDYAIGYLGQFRDSPEALAQMAEKLSKDEMSELLKVLIRTNSSTFESMKTDRSRNLPAKVEANARLSTTQY